MKSCKSQISTSCLSSFWFLVLEAEGFQRLEIRLLIVVQISGLRVICWWSLERVPGFPIAIATRISWRSLSVEKMLLAWANSSISAGERGSKWMAIERERMVSRIWEV